jgi:hypothetical protein
MKNLVIVLFVVLSAACQFRGNCKETPSLCDSDEICSLGNPQADENGCINDGTPSDDCASDADCADEAFPVCNVGASPRYCTQCLEDAHCDEAAGETCNLATERCQEPAQSECDADGNCGEGLICNTDLDPDQCVSTPGGDGDPCDADNDCTSGDCQIDPNVGGVCVGGNVECTIDEDCGEGFVCENDVCLETPDCDFSNGEGFCGNLPGLSGDFYCNGETDRCDRVTPAEPHCDPQEGNADCSQFTNGTCFADFNAGKFYCIAVDAVDQGCNVNTGEPEASSLATVCGADAFCSNDGCTFTPGTPFTPCDFNNDCNSNSCVNTICQ